MDSRHLIYLSRTHIHHSITWNRKKVKKRETEIVMETNSHISVRIVQHIVWQNSRIHWAMTIHTIMHNLNKMILVLESLYFFYTQLWFPTSVRDFLLHSAVISDICPWFSTNREWFPMFLRSYHRKKGIESIIGARATEFTLLSLYSTEITRYRSWFLGCNFTRVNSVLFSNQGSESLMLKGIWL